MAETRKVLRYLQSIPGAPSDPLEYADWVRGKDVLAFLGASRDGSVPIYINGLEVTKGLHLYVYGVLAPANRFDGEYWNDLLEWNFGPPAGWSYGYSMVGKRRFRKPMMFPPLDHTATNILNAAEPIIFARHSQALENTAYLELNQKISHISGVHLSDSRNSYCRLNDLGEIVDVVQIHREHDWSVCVIEREALDLYMFLTKQVLVRVFEVQRWRQFGYQPTHQRIRSLVSNPEQELFAHEMLDIDEHADDAGLGILRARLKT